MIGHWFRLYDGLVDDPKVQKLPAETFRALINLWCLASRNNGVLPPIEDVSFGLRMSEKAALSLLKTLSEQGFIDNSDEGMKPHNWDGRQFKSDVSTERVQRFRKRHETVSRNSPDTEQNRTERDRGASALSFMGKIIRLKESDHALWKQSFKHIDVDAALASRDAYLAETEDLTARKNWFVSTAAWLRNKNEESKKANGKAKPTYASPQFRPTPPDPPKPSEEERQRQIAKMLKVRPTPHRNSA